MPPQPAQPTALDPQLVNLAKSIRQVESGGNFQASGKSGEYGAYQWMPDTWAAKSAAAGVNVPLQQATPEQQNEVAYKTLASWKQQHPDWNVGNFASAWNAGEGDPNAYQENRVGTNTQGVSYNTPAYAEKVANAYQQIKGQTQGQSEASQGQNQVLGASTQQPDNSNLIQQGANLLFPSIGDIGALAQGKSTGKTPVQLAADAALSILPFIPFVGEAGEAIRGAGIAGQIGLGAGAGALQGVAQGENTQGVLASTATGGLTGGALATGGSLLEKLGNALPASIVRKYIPGLSSEEAQYAVAKKSGLGSLDTMYANSNKDISQIETSLSAELKNPKYDYVQPSGDQIIQKALADPKLEESGLAPEDVAKNLNAIAPLQKNLITKLVSGEDMTLTELRKLNTGLGRSIFKRVFDDPTVRAGKDIGSAVYHAISDTIKSAAPDSAPMFDNYQKEIALNSGLEKAIRTGDKKKVFGLPDLLAIMAGFGVSGPLGAMGGLALEKAAYSPTVNLKTAGLVGKLASPAAKRIGGLITPQIARGVGGLVGTGSPPQQ